MLVLSRRESERIRVGESIVVTVVRLGGDKVRIGIEAPSEMSGRDLFGQSEPRKQKDEEA